MDQDLTDPGAISAMRAVAHPVRMRMLSLLTAEAMSAAEVARALELTHANASYHLRVLHDAGEIVVESEERVRGGLARRFRYVAGRQPETGTPATPEDRGAYVKATAYEITRRISHYRRGVGTLGDIETWVTPEVWQEAVGLLARASELLHSSARAPHAEGTRQVSASIFAFEMEPAREGDGS